jgi:prevent-host-death family protein
MGAKKPEISISEFKTKCLRLLDNLGPEGLVVTKRGRPIARVLPARAVDNRRLIGLMRGKIEIKGDILSTGIRWDAESRYPRSRRSPRR